jgi:hypothetical protein
MVLAALSTAIFDEAPIARPQPFDPQIWQSNAKSWDFTPLNHRCQQEWACGAVL